MDRAKCLLVMNTTIDGKISIDWDPWDPSPDYLKGSAEYKRLLFSLAPAYGMGRGTYFEIGVDEGDFDTDLSAYKGHLKHRGDSIIKPNDGELLVAVFDRMGRLRWDGPFIEHGTAKNRIVLITTEKVSDEYLAYLDEKGIGHMFCGKDDIDPTLFLEKLLANYGIDKFIISGGGEINATFVGAGLVDEMHIVVSPAVDGMRTCINFCATDDAYHKGFPKYYKLAGAREIPGGGACLHWIKV